MGILRAILRFFGYQAKRTELAIDRAAEQQFTGSPDGIRDAFDLHQQKLSNSYTQLRDAVAQVEAVLEGDRQRLDELNKQEKELLGLRDGALALFEKAQAANNQAELEEHQKAFESFDGRIQQVESEQSLLEGRMKGSEENMRAYMRQLTELQDEIRRMPQEKARAIADHVSAKKLMELNDRLAGLQSSLDRGPLDAVLTANRDLTAKARISSKLRGTDVEERDAKYKQAGQKVVAGDRMAAMLKERAEKRTTASGEAAPEQKERPSI